MPMCRYRVAVRTILHLVGDAVRLVVGPCGRMTNSAPRTCFCGSSSPLRRAPGEPRRADDVMRITLVALSSLIDWRRVLTIVKPDTLIPWHRKGFQLFWRWNHGAVRTDILHLRG
jgi:hypothetical protein